MKVIFKKESDRTWNAAKKIEKKSIDGCFSPNEIASYLKVGKQLAQHEVDRLEDRGLCSRIDHEYNEIRSGAERWCLIKPSLTIGREYEVLAIVGDDYIILNDPETEPYGNDPVAFHKSLFEIMDPREPSFWVIEQTEDGERCCFPPGWNIDRFFEDYHDRKAEVRHQFWNDIKQYFPNTWKERCLKGLSPGNNDFK